MEQYYDTNIQYGESNQVEYMWSETTKEKIAQIFYQLVRTNDKRNENNIKEKLRIKITDKASGYQELNDDEKFAELNTIRSKYSKGAMAKLFEMMPSTKMRVENPEKLTIGGS